MSSTSALLFFGEVMHARLRPRRNRFRYPVFFVRFPGHRLESLRAGFQAHMAKPVPPLELIEVMATLAGRAAGGPARP